MPHKERDHNDLHKKRSRKSDTVLLFCLVFPLFLTLNYFVLLAAAAPEIQKAAYSIGKIVQFALPVCWIAFVCRESFYVRRINRRGLAEGTLFGITAGAAIILIYFVSLENIFAPESSVSQAIEGKIKGFGLTNKNVFLLIGLFYAVVHSGLEEYYWRWFVFKKLSCPLPLAALGFTAHHIIVLGTYFGYYHPFCWLASLGVFIGGCYWCWLYRRTDSIWGAWIGHGIIDSAIFTVGYLMLK